MATIDDLFQGNTGRLQLVRVMLRLKMPELARRDRREPLSPELEAKILEALEAISRDAE